MKKIIFNLLYKILKKIDPNFDRDVLGEDFELKSLQVSYFLSDEVMERIASEYAMQDIVMTNLKDQLWGGMIHSGVLEIQCNGREMRIDGKEYCLKLLALKKK